MTAGRKSVSKQKDWGTPLKYVNAVHSVFGQQPDLDPCSNQWSIVPAGTKFCLPYQDGLTIPWDYPTIFVNPPFGRDVQRGTTIKDWLRKCHFAHTDFNSEILALIPVAPNTSHWKEFIWDSASSICFLYDTRLKFREGCKEASKGAPMACCMVYWGTKWENFQKIFSPWGAVVRSEVA